MIDLQFFINLGVGLAYKEFLDHLAANGDSENGLKPNSPLLCSECPGWICYLEKVLGDAIIPFASRIKPPQILAAQYTKQMLAKIGLVKIPIFSKMANF